MKEQKIAVYSGTRSLYPYMGTAIKSMLANSSAEKVYLLIEDDVFPEWMPEMVETMNVSGQEFFRPGSINYNSYFTYMALIRACYAKILPETVKKVLQMDVDTIVVDNIDSLWDVDMGGKWFAAVNEDSGTWRPYGDKYFNMGVCMFNLEQMRKDCAAEMLIEYLNKKKLTYIEQDALNDLGRDKVVQLPIRFNESRVTGYTDRPAIVHYAGIMNWKGNYSIPRGERMKEYAEMSWDEALKRHERNREGQP